MRSEVFNWTRNQHFAYALRLPQLRSDNSIIASSTDSQRRCTRAPRHNACNLHWLAHISVLSICIWTLNARQNSLHVRHVSAPSYTGRDTALTVKSPAFPTRWPGFEARPGRAGFVVGKVALGQVFSEDFGFSCQSFSFHRLLHNHHHISSWGGTIDQIVADVPSGLSLTSPQET
jgi:hypothetical protein